jgi:hypothetical protein
MYVHDRPAPGGSFQGLSAMWQDLSLETLLFKLYLISEPVNKEGVNTCTWMPWSVRKESHNLVCSIRGCPRLLRN